MFNWQRVDATAPSDRADFVRQWILRLIDPNTKQGQGRLKDKNGTMCCLGVASVVANIEWELDQDENYYLFESESEHLPESLVDFLKMQSDGDLNISKLTYRNRRDLIDEFDSLMSANDGGVPFRKIAKFIKENPQALMTDLTDAEISFIMETEIKSREKLRNEKRRLKETRADRSEAGQGKG